MLAIVPVKGSNGAKSRLASVLGPAERARLVRSMLDDVLAACSGASRVTATLVVTPDPALVPDGFDVLEDAGRGHGPAVTVALADPRASGGAVVVMADCPLVRPESLDALAAAARPVALVRADDGGMNAFATRAPHALVPAFGTADAVATTVARARAVGIEPTLVDDPLLALDVDRPRDLERVQARILA